MIGKKYILAVALASAPFATQAAETVYTFDTLTGIEHTRNDGRITGILVNDTVPTTVILPSWTQASSGLDRCERLFNLVLSNPAAYSLTVVTDIVMRPGLPGAPDTPVLTFMSCKATVKP